MCEKKQILLGASWSDLFGEFESCGYVREKRGINVDVHVMMPRCEFALTAAPSHKSALFWQVALSARVPLCGRRNKFICYMD